MNRIKKMWNFVIDVTALGWLLVASIGVVFAMIVAVGMQSREDAIARRDWLVKMEKFCELTRVGRTPKSVKLIPIANSAGGMTLHPQTTGGDEYRCYECGGVEYCQ